MKDKLKVLDLFSGIGGFSLGLERTGGFSTVAFCEIEEFPREVLQKHWPEIPIYGDITNARFKEDVDLVTAGFPCQDISLAGQGAGLSGERSGLFWYILRTLCMVGRPRACLENVAALLNRGLSIVLGALASFGYDAEWHCIPASHVGAPHIRDRIWIVADSNIERKSQPKRVEQGFRGRFGDCGEDVANTKSDIQRAGFCESEQEGKRGRRFNNSDSKGDVADTYGERLQEWSIHPRREGQAGFTQPRQAPERTCRWPAEPTVCGMDDGLSNGLYQGRTVSAESTPKNQRAMRVHRLKCLGNSVVPKIPEMIGYAILESEKED